MVSVAKKASRSTHKLRDGAKYRYRSKKKRWTLYYLDEEGHFKSKVISWWTVPSYKFRKKLNHGTPLRELLGLDPLREPSS